MLRLLALLGPLLLALPLLGAALAGRPIARYLQFPPTTEAAAQPPFSWPVFTLLAAAIALSVAPFLVCLLRHRRAVAAPARAARAFPAWGWAGVVLLAASWWLAWHRYPWFEALQPYTFTPLWLGYILAVNALAYRRGGPCLLVDKPRILLALFPLSALFWWFFEYLNRFVQNWYYVGAGALEPAQYFWRSTLPFATVLPAVLSTYVLLAGFPALTAGLASGRAWKPARPRGLAWLVLIGACLGLVGVGALPEILYPLVWIAPLLVLLALQSLAGRSTVLSPIGRGDWRACWRAALAALACGLCWELWNSGSLAHWRYSIPYVDRFHLFEMPLLGYAGYLPFGIQCLAVASLADPGVGQSEHES